VNRRTSFQGYREVDLGVIQGAFSVRRAWCPTGVGVLGNLLYERSPVSTYRSVRAWTSRLDVERQLRHCAIERWGSPPTSGITAILPTDAGW